MWCSYYFDLDLELAQEVLQDMAWMLVEVGAGDPDSSDYNKP